MEIEITLVGLLFVTVKALRDSLVGLPFIQNSLQSPFFLIKQRSCIFVVEVMHVRLWFGFLKGEHVDVFK